MIVKFNPVFKNKMWGGDKFKKMYGYDCSSSCGEVWGISAHPNGMSYVAEGKYIGLSLKELYENHSELFGNYPDPNFPILVKIIDAKEDLSIQVHPGDKYAKSKHNSKGKTEYWYILDAEENTEIIVGHTAKTKSELRKLVQNNQYDTLLNKDYIKKHDTFYIPSGKVHAICKGTVLLEVQQSSDITYRLYDYNRLLGGLPRDLHIEDSLNVITVPDVGTSNKPNPYFSFDILDSKTEEVSDKYGDYIFIIDGHGHINNTSCSKGDFIFIPANTEYSISKNIVFQRTRLK